MKINACLTCKSDQWSTPKDIYNYYVYDLGYFDPCPLNDHPIENGLYFNWNKYNFVNPPYSDLTNWVVKALYEKDQGHHIVMLIPARTDTRWFKLLYNHNAHFYLISGRLRFGESSTSAPFPSMFVILDKSFTYPYIKLIDKIDFKEFVL